MLLKTFLFRLLKKRPPMEREISPPFLGKRGSLPLSDEKREKFLKGHFPTNEIKNLELLVA